MKVKAKHQVAYAGKLYQGGDTFDITPEDLNKYLTDVDVVEESKTKREKTKPVEAMRTKTK